MERVRCAKKDACHVWTSRAQTIDWCSYRRLNFHKLLSSITCPENRQVWCGTMKLGTDQLSSDLDFRARSSFSLYFSAMLDLWWSTFCQRRQKWPAATADRGTVLPKVVAAVQEQWPNVGTIRTLLLPDSAAPYKARATIQCLVGEKWQVLSHPPYRLLPIFCFENWSCWKEVFANSRLCKSDEFTTWCLTPFWGPYHLPGMAKATATLCWQPS